MKRGGFTIGRGSASLEVSGELTRMVEKVIRELAPTVVDALEREVEALTLSAAAQWPVGDDKEGRYAKNKDQPYHSADRFFTGIRFVGDGIEAFIDNDAVNRKGQRYFYYIKSGGVSPLQVLIRKPLKKISLELAKELADDIRKLVREG